jgi:hypothetical protein
MSRPGRKGREIEVRKLKTRAQTRKKMPGIQNARDIVLYGKG